MQYRHLGNSGLMVSALALGSGMSTLGEKVDAKTFEAILMRAFEKGVNLIDTAENYGMGKAPQMIGDILQRVNMKRSSYILMDKVFYGGREPHQVGLSQKRIHESCDKALIDLKTDYIDIFLCHAYDPNTPLEETASAMHTLVQNGKILHWGTSNWNALQMNDLLAVCKAHDFCNPIAHQPCYNLMNKQEVEESLTPVASQHNIGFTTYSPLNCGFLSGKYKSTHAENTRLQLPRFRETKAELLSSERALQYSHLIDNLHLIAQQYECTSSQLAIAWCLKNPHVCSVILGSTSVEQITENLEALTVLEKISEETMQELNKISIEMPA